MIKAYKKGGISRSIRLPSRSWIDAQSASCHAAIKRLYPELASSLPARPTRVSLVRVALMHLTRHLDRISEDFWARAVDECAQIPEDSATNVPRDEALAASIYAVQEHLSKLLSENATLKRCFVYNGFLFFVEQNYVSAHRVIALALVFLRDSA